MPRAGYQRNGVYIPTPPRDVLRVGELMQYRSEERLYLVRFFDNKRNWWDTPYVMFILTSSAKSILKNKVNCKWFANDNTDVRKIIIGSFTENIYAWFFFFPPLEVDEGKIYDSN